MLRFLVCEIVLDGAPRRSVAILGCTLREAILVEEDLLAFTERLKVVACRIPDLGDRDRIDVLCFDCAADLEGRLERNPT